MIKIFEQGEVEEILTRAIKKDRLSHTLLFYGPAGCGKEIYAFWLAKILNCKDRTDTTPCNECTSCQKISHFSHPDVQWVFPAPGSVKDKDLAEIFQTKRQDFFYQPRFAKRCSISIDAVRSLKRISTMQPYEGKKKVFVITSVDLMTTEASNSFLKLLEEPPDNAQIILTTSRPYMLLSTVISRCQMIRFNPLKEQQVTACLNEKFDLPQEKVRLISALSGGNLHRAIDLMEEDIWKLREAAVMLFELAVEGGIEKQYAYLLNPQNRYNWNELHDILDLMLIWLRDIFAISSGDKQRKYVINVDLLQKLDRWSEGLPSEELISMMQELEESKSLQQRNVNAQLILWRVLTRLGYISNAGGRN